VGMNGLRVTELAEAAGVAPSTVRFYERVGLLASARRADNGYRLFDPSALDELAFIARAKGIGLSLEEIAELVSAWPQTECRRLRARLHGCVVERIDRVRAQQAELGSFADQLQAVLGRLANHEPGLELCGKGCGCETDLDLTGVVAGTSTPPWLCSLDGEALTSRIAEWKTLAARAVSVEHAGDTLRLGLPADPDLLATAARLCAAETACCPTTSFILEIRTDQAVLVARAAGSPGLLETLLS
jgi:MerR family transcriptional regulator, copper efflux regulator